MEIQVTDFENAAFSIFIVLITRAILSFDLNFYIPITRTDENMQTAHRKDAVLEQKFWFRKNPFPTRAPRPYSSNGNHTNGASTHGTNTPAMMSRPPTPTGPVEDEYCLMGIDEIMNGTKLTSGNDDGQNFPGLIPLVESYLDSMNVDVATRCELASYLELIKKRANGTLWTAAKWIREFVRGHEDYKGDSVVDDRINHDLIKAVIDIEAGSESRKRVKSVNRFLGTNFGCG